MHQIILEGCDNAGKSTIGKALSRLMKIPLRDRIVRVGPERVLTAHITELARPAVILDRCYFISDSVYEPIYSGNPSATAHLREALAKITRECALVVHVTADQQTIIDRYEQEGDDLYDLSQVLMAKQRYDEFFEETRMAHMMINTSQCSPDVAARVILEAYKNRGGK